MATLEIVFFGLIAFAPDPAGKLWALMPRTDTCPPCVAKCTPCLQEETYPEHNPTLAIPDTLTLEWKNLNGGTCPSELTVPGLPSGYTYVPLRGYEVKVTPTSADKLNYTARMTGSATKSTPDPKYSDDKLAFDWAGKISESASALAEINPDCLKNDCGGEVVARLLMESGQVSTACLVPWPPGLQCDYHLNSREMVSTQTFMFKTDNAWIPMIDRALAEGVKVSWALTSEAPAVTFVLSGLATPGTEICKISVTTNGNATLSILHQHMIDPAPKCDGKATHGPESYRQYYRLSKNLPVIEAAGYCSLPYPEEWCTVTATPKCPSAVFDIK